ncbi:DUF1294 domain-containing protein [Shewanella intestini]|uniref:DUF1294 domain-containing protein n=1 Tax=Shewanella intestini TaxID=2017544 RepID=A0ABS5I2X2_9GAMM|nr:MULTISPECIES: cold shock and DUF1294 domain-containing protein [Shewanella]MBR9728382.1 DUF1294 domain-containing protein [Shewanella intestini]MRG36724.1 DUF1294 domain-containing protein [Shewanella sp. XMDDZSB0408]
MKYQGPLSHWNDDKGFGFVEPNGGGVRAFVHIKAFKNRTRRPVAGDIIVYHVAKDPQGRDKAMSIQYANELRQAMQRSGPREGRRRGAAFGQLFLLGFIVGLSASTVLGYTQPIIAAIYVLMSIVTFVTYAIDKSNAQKGHWRTRESTLHLMGLLGGWPGGAIAQRLLRHKSSKTSFKRTFWLMIALNLGGFLWLHTPNGTFYTDIVNGIFLQ